MEFRTSNAAAVCAPPINKSPTQKRALLLLLFCKGARAYCNSSVVVVIGFSARGWWQFVGPVVRRAIFQATQFRRVYAFDSSSFFWFVDICMFVVSWCRRQGHIDNDTRDANAARLKRVFSRIYCMLFVCLYVAALKRLRSECKQIHADEIPKRRGNIARRLESHNTTNSTTHTHNIYIHCLCNAMKTQ